MIEFILGIALLVLCLFTTFLVINHRVKCIKYEEEIRSVRERLNANYRWNPGKTQTIGKLIEAIKPIAYEQLSYPVNELAYV